MAEEWVRTYESPGGADWSESLGGREWGRGRTPWRWHRCTPQTRGSFPTRMGSAELVERCDCGGTRLDGGPWMTRNWTRDQARDRRRAARLPVVGVVCSGCGKYYEAPEGSDRAAARDCTDCWTARFLADGRP